MFMDKVGMELEISRQRTPFVPRVAKNDSKIVSFSNVESDAIVEFSLKPVKFTNERNLIRRLLLASYVSYFTPTLSRELKDWLDFSSNYCGAWSYSGESNHLHISFKGVDDYGDDEEEYYGHKEDLTLYIWEKAEGLIPLLQRTKGFRDTLYSRAYVFFEDNPEVDSKENALTYNTGFGTFEFRINENSFPLLFILLLQYLLDEDESIEAHITACEKAQVHRLKYREDIKTIVDNIKSLCDKAILYYRNNGNRFSANGRYYIKALKIAKELLEEMMNNDEIITVSDFGSFNQRFFERIDEMMSRDRIWNKWKALFNRAINLLVDDYRPFVEVVEQIRRKIELLRIEAIDRMVKANRTITDMWGIICEEHSVREMLVSEARLSRLVYNLDSLRVSHEGLEIQFFAR